MSDGAYVLVISTSILLVWLIVIATYSAVEDWLEFRAGRDGSVPRFVDWATEFDWEA